MKKPNFFILGAPKCGTTSLAAWLSKHPNVFFPPVKEPFFFNFDFGERRFKSLIDYEKLFSKTRDVHISVGEGSTSYLYSRTAVPAILRYVKKPLFIVMARNPAEMAYSLHEQQVFNSFEIEKEFESAWALQNVRFYGGYIPTACPDPQILFYGDRCKVGKQLNRLFEIVSRDQVLVLNLDHMKQDARQEYLRVLDFLGIKDDGRQDFPIFNTAKERKSPILWRTVTWFNRSLSALGFPRVRLGFTSFIHRVTRKERPRPPLKPEMRRMLQEYFKEDVILLEQLTGWDLSEWKSKE